MCVVLRNRTTEHLATQKWSQLTGSLKVDGIEQLLGEREFKKTTPWEGKPLPACHVPAALESSLMNCVTSEFSKHCI